MQNLKQKTLFNYKEGTSFIDCPILSSNKNFGRFILRMWFSIAAHTEMSYHFELLEGLSNNKVISWESYYVKHSIDQLKTNNLANKMIRMQNFIFAHEV